MTQPLVTNVAAGLNYVGGRVLRSTTYAYGLFCISEDGNTIFSMHGPEIKQHPMVDAVNTLDTEQMALVTGSIQEVNLQTRGFSPGMSYGDTSFRPKGIIEVDGQLIVSYINFYDGSADEVNNVLVIRNSDDMANSPIDGPFQLRGGGASAGAIAKLHPMYHDLFEGSLVATTTYAAIVGRLSCGPSALSFYPEELVGQGEIKEPTDPIDLIGNMYLNYPYANGNILYNKTKFPDSLVSPSNRAETLLYGDPVYDGNGDRIEQDLWTIMSKVAIAFVPEGTNSLVCLGQVRGATAQPTYEPNDNVPKDSSGVIYKSRTWRYRDGAYVLDADVGGGDQLFVEDDQDTYFWVYDLDDIQLAKDGALNPWDLRPYSYGPLSLGSLINGPTPISEVGFAAGHYFSETNKLYLSNASVYTESSYHYPVVYEYDLDIEALVQGSSIPPVLDIAYPKQVKPNSVTNLTATVKNFDNAKTYTYNWTVESGGVTLSSTSGSSVSYTAPPSETDVVVRCTANDGTLDSYNTKAATQVTETIANPEFPVDYERVATIQVNTSKVSGDIPDFEATITEESLGTSISDLMSNISDTGGNLRLSSDISGQNRLPLDLLYLDKANSNITLNTKIPVSASVATKVYIWTGPETAKQPARGEEFGSYDSYSGASLLHLGMLSSGTIPKNSASTRIVSQSGDLPNLTYGVGQNYNGSSTRIAIAADPMGVASGMSLSATITPEAAGAIYGSTLNNSKGFIQLSINGDNELYCIIYSAQGNMTLNSSATSSTIPFSVESTVAITWNGVDTYKLYLNGVVVDSLTSTNVPRDLSNERFTDIYLGGRRNDTQGFKDYFSGKIRSATIWGGDYKTQERVETEHQNITDPSSFWQEVSEVVVPTANAGADQTVGLNDTINFNFGSSTSNSAETIATYNLTQTSGTSVAIVGGNTISNPTATAPGAETTLVFDLTVTDTAGTTSPVDSVTINVVADNLAPVANAGTNQSDIAAGATVNLSGTASSDSDGTIASYSWTQVSGDTVSLSSTTSATPSFVAPSTSSDQTLVFNLVVTDNEGLQSPASTVSIFVKAITSVVPISFTDLPNGTYELILLNPANQAVIYYNDSLVVSNSNFSLDVSVPVGTDIRAMLFSSGNEGAMDKITTE